MLPELPVEVTEHIISILWLSPLSPSHRTIFIKSSHLVSRTWSSTFSRIAARDVHILSASHGFNFFQMLLGQTFLTYPLDQLCRSITFQHEHGYLLPGPEKDEQLIGKAIHDIISAISSNPKRLPLLRRIALEMKNFLMETIFEHNPFLNLPYQVRELDLHFEYGVETDPMTVQIIKSRGNEKFGITRGSLPSLRRLKVKGASSGVTKALLDACDRERLLVFEQDAWKQDEPVQPIILPSVYRDEDFHDDEDDDDDESEEEFHDCEEEEQRVEDEGWEGYEKMLTESFSKDELSRLIVAFQRQL
uniref:Uncharacterized protein n=1 Tax=Moniliophthora roreri TaxID=221103 RepID=A0A0W0G5X4_MONRR